jgi:hypothetical protein
MRRDSQAATSILRRIAELSAELRRTRAQLKCLRIKDDATGDAVLRGAQLARERSMLERRLETIRLSQAPQRSI